MNIVKFIILLVATLFWKSFVFGQYIYNSLTIISEDKKAFYLFIDGKQYNREAYTTVRIENIPFGSVQCRIQYAERQFPPIEIAQLQLADADGNKQDITYAIHTKRRNANAFLVYQIIPVIPIRIDPTLAVMYKYGEQRAYDWRDLGNNQGGNQPSHWRQNAGNSGSIRDVSILTNEDVASIINTLDKESFDKNRMMIVKQGLIGKLIKTEDIIKLMETFSFEDGKLELAKYAYNFCSDKRLYYQVTSALKFSSNKKELQQFIDAQQK